MQVRRLVIIWSVVIGVMAAIFAITVVVLNATVFTPSGFARVYLDSLARHDAQGALALPGVTVPDGARTELLQDAALGDVSDVRVVEEHAIGVDDVPVFGELAGERDLRLVETEVRLGVWDEPTTVHFVIGPADPVLGVFNGWRFAQSPIATIHAEPLHDDRFEVNGIALTSPETVTLAALVPGQYEMLHESALFEADPVVIPVRTPGGAVQATLDIRANPTFVERVQQELNTFLDECATQRVLLPAGCPFGHQINNRVESEPVWSITGYPQVQIVPGQERGTWIMPRSEGVAHLTVDVRSLFDGSRSTFDDDVTFTVAYEIRVQPDGRLQITAITG